MKHLIVCREYPPFPYPPGGIGTYVDHISRLLVEHGETVHVVGQRWPGAPRAREIRCGGRLVIHRVSLDEPLPYAGPEDAAVLRSMQRSAVPVQAFAWQVARLAEVLAAEAAIDVIEAQEYEAPLYHLLHRRALGLAPPTVPVVIHLHTPSEFLFEQNEWDSAGVDCLLLKRLEEYTIRAADALLCPSRFLADIAERRYQTPPGSIEVMPYPIGDTPVLPRSETIWRTGTICYVGRLEPRKGVREWVDAAVSVAREDPVPRFVLIGGDPVFWGTGGTSFREMLRSRIPEGMRRRFSFVDAIPRAQLAGHLRQARLAVVPSRWENFPNTCIEAMSSGLPVLVSPTGGMVEMVDDGVTGWIAAGAEASSLAAALRRALAASPSDLARMGSAAAASIRAKCDNTETVRRHLDFRRRVARGARWMEAPAARDPARSRSGHLATLAGEIGELSRRSAAAPIQSAGTMTPLDLLRASPRQQLAALRRATANPRYVAQWVAWHGRRALRLSWHRLSSLRPVR